MKKETWFKKVDGDWKEIAMANDEVTGVQRWTMYCSECRRVLMFARTPTVSIDWQGRTVTTGPWICSDTTSKAGNLIQGCGAQQDP